MAFCFASIWQMQPQGNDTPVSSRRRADGRALGMAAILVP